MASRQKPPGILASECGSMSSFTSPCRWHSARSTSGIWLQAGRRLLYLDHSREPRREEECKSVGKGQGPAWKGSPPQCGGELRGGIPVEGAVRLMSSVAWQAGRELGVKACRSPPQSDAQKKEAFGLSGLDEGESERARASDESVMPWTTIQHRAGTSSCHRRQVGSSSYAQGLGKGHDKARKKSLKLR
ncbi:hypothetical protein BCV70DRAFT_114739 [Testicularia cyperi]|uniref:Uncharacterized protein n=1 Tax=Testicularia cyperi TaxID=1882483 RepID=A0A317XG29_9BASI|nr:hypothetical protein BCV70DRAFT_114739 [Testicularia cyperi]